MLCPRSDVFTDHVVLIDNLQEAVLNGIQLMLQLRDVLFLVYLELFHYFLLSGKIASEHIILRRRLVQLLLEAGILLRQNLNLLLQLVVLDFSVLRQQQLVSMVSLGLLQLRRLDIVILLLFLEALNPLRTSFFFTLQNLRQVVDLFVKLLLGELELALNTLFLRVQLFNLTNCF